ncbi:hypothetical protein [Aquiflexum lacus]|uniref:hypothetical protein n=1 Tax=Aquiflexum lacus TaxID=2483805 RepID=UPI0018941A09|nr:hypothetical protein [Aquiflexum lacus]
MDLKQFDWKSKEANINPIDGFIKSIRNDPRICISHIGLFTVLYHQQVEYGGQAPFPINREEIMEASKISSTATYFKILNQLADFGYIRYMPTYNRMKNSTVQII